MNLAMIKHFSSYDNSTLCFSSKIVLYAVLVIGQELIVENAEISNIVSNGE